MNLVSKKWLRIVATIAAFPVAVMVLVIVATGLLGLSNDRDTRHESGEVRWDASHLNPVHVAGVVEISPDSATAINQLVDALHEARAKGLKIAISGARHSMGGQSAYVGGIVLDMLSHNGMYLDSMKGNDGTKMILRVQSGARWSEVIPFLDAHGFSVRIMQSNNPFTVGGTLSVNAHGWQQNEPPFISSVESFRVFTAEGVVKNCSRTENQELFHAVAGGYGLFGVVLDIDLRVMPNELYRADRVQCAAAEYPLRYHDVVDGDSTLGLVYGRLSVAPGSFLNEALLTRYVRLRKPVPTFAMAGVRPDPFYRFKHLVFLAGVGNGFGKEVRWMLEENLGGESATEATRNRLLDDPIDLFENRDSTRTQLLHEYFVPRDSLEPFLRRARLIIPAYSGDLLNVTIRSLSADSDSYLNYARENVFSLVMLFSQATTSEADNSMRRMTVDLIDAALAVRGTYYLPYRLHATKEQFRRAYPMADAFFALKKQYDPDEIFQNQLYKEYSR